MTDKIQGQCQECGVVYEFVPNPKYPRKYCPECSAAKKASYGAKDDGAFPLDDVIPVEKPGVPIIHPECFKQPITPKQHTTMYVSYAKDIFCALITQSNETTANGREIMHTAIELVKQAQEAFS